MSKNKSNKPSRPNTPPKSKEELKADSFREIAPGHTVLEATSPIESYQAHNHKITPGLYGRINPTSPGQVELMYYASHVLEKDEGGCPMNLSMLSTDTRTPQSAYYKDLTGVVNCDEYSQSIGKTHTEVALCSRLMYEAIKTGTDVIKTQVPRAYVIHSTLPPCEEHCLGYYQDGTFLRYNWQVEPFLNHSNARRDQAVDDAGRHLDPDLNRWQNYNWLVVFKDSDSHPLKSYAVCTRMLGKNHYERLLPACNSTPKKRWLGDGWVNGLVRLTSNADDLRNNDHAEPEETWQNLFIAEKNVKGTIFKGLDVLTQDYVYWFLTGRNPRYSPISYDAAAYLPPKIGDFSTTLAQQFDYAYDVFVQRMLTLPHTMQPAFLLTMMATLSELFSRCVSQQTLTNIPDPTSLPASEAATTPARSAKKRGRSSSPSEEEQSSLASQQSSSAKRSKSQESPSTPAHQDTMPMVYALIQSAWTLAGQAARLQREEQRQASLTQLQANISQFFAQRHRRIGAVTAGAVPGSSTHGPSSASSSSSSSYPAPSSTLVSGSGLHQPQADIPEPRTTSSSSAVSDLHPSLPNAPENIRLCIRRRSESDDAESATDTSERPSQRHPSARARASSSAPAQRHRMMRITRDDDESLDADLFNTAVPDETRAVVQGIMHRVRSSTQRTGSASLVERPARERAVVTADGQLALLPPGSDSETEIVSDSDTEISPIVTIRRRGGNNTRQQAARRR